MKLFIGPGKVFICIGGMERGLAATNHKLICLIQFSKEASHTYITEWFKAILLPSLPPRRFEAADREKNRKEKIRYLKN